MGGLFLKNITSRKTSLEQENLRFLIHKRNINAVWQTDISWPFAPGQNAFLPSLMLRPSENRVQKNSVWDACLSYCIYGRCTFLYFVMFWENSLVTLLWCSVWKIKPGVSPYTPPPQNNAISDGEVVQNTSQFSWFFRWNSNCNDEMKM